MLAAINAAQPTPQVSHIMTAHAVADPDPLGSGPFLPDPDAEICHQIRIRIPPWLCKVV